MDLSIIKKKLKMNQPLSQDEAEYLLWIAEQNNRTKRRYVRRLGMAFREPAGEIDGRPVYFKPLGTEVTSATRVDVQCSLISSTENGKIVFRQFPRSIRPDRAYHLLCDALVKFEQALETQNDIERETRPASPEDSGSDLEGTVRAGEDHAVSHEEPDLQGGLPGDPTAVV